MVNNIIRIIIISIKIIPYHIIIYCIRQIVYFIVGIIYMIHYHIFFFICGS